MVDIPVKQRLIEDMVNTLYSEERRKNELLLALQNILSLANQTLTKENVIALKAGVEDIRAIANKAIYTSKEIS
jgi:hypothetical protein